MSHCTGQRYVHITELKPHEICEGVKGIGGRAVRVKVKIEDSRSVGQGAHVPSRRKFIVASKSCSHGKSRRGGGGIERGEVESAGDLTVRSQIAAARYGLLSVCKAELISLNFPVARARKVLPRGHEMRGGAQRGLNGHQENT